jgi:hypothetical protein
LSQLQLTAVFLLAAGPDMGKDAGAKAAAVTTYELLRGEEGQAFGRIVVNLSMLRDHYLSSYVKALQELEKQWAAEMAVPAE